jgi:hypothetical protein
VSHVHNGDNGCESLVWPKRATALSRALVVCSPHVCGGPEMSPYLTILIGVVMIGLAYGGL